MSCQKRQLTVNGTASLSAVAVPGVARAGRAVTAAMAPASKDLLADARTPCEPEGVLDGRLKPNVVAVATPMRPATQQLVLPAGRIALTGSAEAQDAHTQALSQVKEHVARTLHETVMQTLVAIIYLAESPTTSRRELIEYLRQGTHELRCVIDGLAASEDPPTRPSAPMGLSLGHEPALGLGTWADCDTISS